MRRPSLSSCLLAALAALGAAAEARADFMDHFVVRDDVGPHKVPAQGAVPVLVIPVEVQGFPPVDRAALTRFFGEDPAGFAEYYRSASLERYRPYVTVAPTVRFETCPLDPQQFPGCKVRRGDFAALAAGTDMMREVVRRADELGVDFAALDATGRRGTPDGFVDGVMVLTNTPFGGIAFPIGYFNRGDNLAGGMGGPLVVDGVKIPHIAIAGELDTFVMVHEFGHLLGLTDLYDESRRYAGLELSVMGAWHYDRDIPYPDAETRFRLGWTQWHQATGTQTLLLQPGRYGQVVRVGQGDQYFLLENRGPGAFDKAFTVRGLAIFQVDRTVKLRGEEGRFTERLLDCVNCDPWHPYIRLAQADGRFDLEAHRDLRYEDDLFRDGDALRPDPTGVPRGPDHKVDSTNLYTGAPTGFVIRDVKVRPDQAIEVTVEAPEVDPCAESLCAEGAGCKAVNCEGEGLLRGCGCGALEGAPGVGLLLFALLTSCGRAPRRRRAARLETPGR